MRTLILLALVLTACSAPEKPGPLQKLVGAATSLAPCSSVIPTEWASSFAVPAPGSSGKEFFVFFYALEGAPPKPPTLYVPGGDAKLDLASGKPESCALRRVNVAVVRGDRWPAYRNSLTFKQDDALETRLFDATERVAAVYAAKRTPTPDDAKAAKEFMDLWEKGAEPLYQADYYKLNPDFWEWLRGAAGRSIPKP